MTQRRVQALSDLRAELLDAVAADAEEVPVEAVADCLLRSGICDQVSFQSIELADLSRTVIRIWPDPTATERLLRQVDASSGLLMHPVAVVHLEGRGYGVFAPDDVSPQWRRSEGFRHLRTSIGVVEQLDFPLEVRPGAALSAFGVGRSGRPFSLAERDHVEEVWRTVAAAQAVVARTRRLRRDLARLAPDVRQDLVDVPAVTGREREVVLALLTGASRRSVARDLGISLRTVDKHLEHVNAKLGTASLLQAARRLGVLQDVRSP
ncbi:helix-turn-helix transcriptional regulator [Kineococcus sp. SYSU DK003]|uniref:helix-turn-helix transcriptional regulator n=1 Tax=Kineococcus sp. SYSU DK003 TaxID=3383124 RepID=UPI003D7E8F80